MKPLPVVLALLLALAATPTAAAASFDLGASKIVERALDPGEEAVFEMPILVNQDGFLYGKVLPTPGNAVNDGARANGSVADGSGWSVSFALAREDGTRVELGRFVDSTVSARAPVANGERPTFVATVHVPASAAQGGPQQRVYVAVAYRPFEASGGGGSSGGVIDEARALTLILSNALLPPAAQAAQKDGASEVAEGDDASGDPDAPAPGTEDPDEDAGVQESTEADEVPPVQAIPGVARGTTVQVTALPEWFLAGALLLGTGFLVVLSLMTRALFLMTGRREPPANAPAADADRAMAIPVREAQRGRVDVSTLQEE